MDFRYIINENFAFSDSRFALGTIVSRLSVTSQILQLRLCPCRKIYIYLTVFAKNVPARSSSTVPGAPCAPPPRTPRLETGPSRIHVQVLHQQCFMSTEKPQPSLTRFKAAGENLAPRQSLNLREGSPLSHAPEK